MVVKSDCFFFRGDVPCTPNKKRGMICESCSEYRQTTTRILIIKLGAAGDVIRTTPLLRKLEEEHPSAAIWWVCYTPELVPATVYRRLPYSTESVETIKQTEFDIAINLDKDLAACALMKAVLAKEKIGFTLSEGLPSPINSLAQDKFLTGLFDSVSQSNRSSYVREIFQICGWQFSGEEYILNRESNRVWTVPNDKPLIGLNTGCGARWKSRIWKNDHWLELIRLLRDAGCNTLLLGGDQENDNNEYLSQESDALYLGSHPFDDFIALMDHCFAIVSGVTLGMHLAIGLKKPLILINNIFNPHEFEMYGRGEIVQPDKNCTCYFAPKCNNLTYNCMDHLPASKVAQAVQRVVSMSRE